MTKDDFYFFPVKISLFMNEKLLIKARLGKSFYLVVTTFINYSCHVILLNKMLGLSI